MTVIGCYIDKTNDSNWLSLYWQD